MSDQIASNDQNFTEQKHVTKKPLSIRLWNSVLFWIVSLLMLPLSMIWVLPVCLLKVRHTKKV